MKKVRRSVLAGAVGASALCGVVFFAASPKASPAPKVLIDSESVELTTPVDACELSQAEIDLATEAYYAGEPLPSGYSAESLGAVHAVMTGTADAETGEREVLISVVDDPADLDLVTVELNGDPIGRAERLDGGVVDRGSMSEATLSVWLPDPATADPYELVLRWRGLRNGSERAFTYAR